MNYRSRILAYRTVVPFDRRPNESIRLAHTSSRCDCNNLPQSGNNRCLGPCRAVSNPICDHHFYRLSRCQWCRWNCDSTLNVSVWCRSSDDIIRLDHSKCCRSMRTHTIAQHRRMPLQMWTPFRLEMWNCIWLLPTTLIRLKNSCIPREPVAWQSPSIAPYMLSLRVNYFRVCRCCWAKAAILLPTCCVSEYKKKGVRIDYTLYLFYSNRISRWMKKIIKSKYMKKYVFTSRKVQYWRKHIRHCQSYSSRRQPA